MSTGIKRPCEQALADAEEFKALFSPMSYRRWEFAGSLRRGRPDVGDIEHIIIPEHGDIETADGLFSIHETVNLLWHCLDALVRGGQVEKHWYGGGGAPHRWGAKYRGASFRGFAHELFTADTDNWGAQLLIRTGPAGYSKRVVTYLKDGGLYRQQGGELVVVATGEPVSVPDEATYLKLAGLPFLPPERRV